MLNRFEVYIIWLIRICVDILYDVKFNNLEWNKERDIVFWLLIFYIILIMYVILSL